MKNYVIFHNSFVFFVKNRIFAAISRIFLNDKQTASRLLNILVFVFFVKFFSEFLEISAENGVPHALH